MGTLEIDKGKGAGALTRHSRELGRGLLKGVSCMQQNVKKEEQSIPMSTVDMKETQEAKKRITL